MIKTYILDEKQEITEEMKAEIRNAANQPIEFDEDCPELTPELMKSLKCAVIQRNRSDMLKNA